MAFKLVLADLDGTLLKDASAERLFIMDLFKQGLLKGPQIRASSMFMFRWLNRFRKEVLKKNKAYLAGLPV